MADRVNADRKKAEGKEWEVEYTDEFEGWWNGLTEAEQEDIAAVVGVLREKGPSLRRPVCRIDSYIEASEHEGANHSA